MKKEIADKWVAALRSDDYRQGRGVLKSSGPERDERPAFCCLGVLCDLYAAEHRDEPAWRGDDTIMGEDCHLPTAVMLWSGISTENGLLACGKVAVDNCDHEECPHSWHDNLADMNDEGCTFEQIADVISNHVGDL